MKIGIVLATTPGYSETFFRSKILGLQKEGHEVLLFTQNREANFNLCKVVVAPRVYRLSIVQLLSMGWVCIKLIPSASRVIRLITLERKEGRSLSDALKSVYLNAHILPVKLDWLHFGFATQALGRELVATAIHSKMAVSFRGFDINVYPSKHPGCYRLLWKYVDKVHSISNYLRDKAINLGLPSEKPYQIISPAVDLSKIPDYYVEGVTGNRWVTIARLNWIKGLDVALHAMAQLKQRGMNFEYIIIGGGEQKELERCQYLAYLLNLESEVLFVGKISHEETLRQLKQASLYIQPSLNEGFCNSVLEAQAMGIMTLASNVGGLKENIEHKVSGWLFEVGNSKDLAHQIEQVLNLTKDQKGIVSEAAKLRVKTKFSMEDQQRSFVKFYTAP
jgi:glycosyltransferase involved in cell wall biosynthesis